MRIKTSAAFALLSAALLCLGAIQAGEPAPAAGAQPVRRPLVQMTIESKAFEDGGVVPEKYAFRGGNVQPDFKISNVTPEVQSFAIIFHDLDVAGGGNTEDVLHWTAWNIPGSTREIAEGKLPEGSVMGKNRTGTYMGPGAPSGPRYHHYVFEFYALDSKLDLPVTTTRAELLAAMNGKVVAKAAYVGRYKGNVPPGSPVGGPPPAAR